MKTHHKKITGAGLTFDDVLIVPRRSGVLPSQVELKTMVTRKIGMNIPLLSAAMDTVTEWELAIALAREGGMGVIHKTLSIEEQAAQVSKVKRSESFTISNPITLPPHVPLATGLAVMQKHNISGIPIVENEKVVGMLTSRDIRFVEDVTRPISDYMTKKPLITVPPTTSREEALRILHEERIEKLPVVDEHGTLVGLITAKDVQKKKKHPHACLDEKGRLRVGAAVGVLEDTPERVAALIDAEVDLVTVDTAHGHSDSVVHTVEEVKKAHPRVQIIAGNVATGEGTKRLISAGADGVKVGMGAGAICTTRVIAGIGVPQVTAILDCTEVAEAAGIPIIADGGVRYSGDVAKSLAAGAQAVMIGSLFAGTEEAPGEMLLWEGRTYKVYYGMGSLAAMKKGSGDRYFQAGAEVGKMVPEGIEGRVPYRGKLADIIFQLCGGLRASMGYCGCTDIDTFRRETKFVQVTGSGVVESHPHDIVISREAPNYQVKL